ncbi:unnamed protein product [Didymodactylos carnosus]|uniref:Uncharacterized protein n=1 Tax=Didymodactylos carnosus TaxID=1234261 RepID=A0A8S2N4N4_9BILA|nr:unnamed protein product [Didymodactylos carnosus]CAF3984873.1 unnamed protein product [Didymodactylos carnosus]
MHCGTFIYTYSDVERKSASNTSWYHTLVSKYKTKRRPIQGNVEINARKQQHSQVNSGRPIKKQDLSLIERGPEKRTGETEENTDTLVSDMKNELVKIDYDVNKCYQKWMQTIQCRRMFVRNHPLNEVLSEFPGYCISKLIQFQFDLLKLLQNVSVKVHNILSVLIPYPCLIINEQSIDVYVNWLVISSTSSLDEAIALLISMYNISEIKFDPRSRTVRLLYITLLNERKYISNSIRSLLNELNYDSTREKMKSTTTSSAVLASSTKNVSSSTAQFTVPKDDLTEINNFQTKSELVPTTSKPSLSNDLHLQELNSSSSSATSLSTQLSTQDTIP